jgi:hypothetical protein
MNNINTHLNIETQGTNVDVSLRSQYGSGYITAMIRIDSDDETEQEFYSISIIHPIDSSDWYRFGHKLRTELKGLRFVSAPAAVSAAVEHLESIKIEA